MFNSGGCWIDESNYKYFSKDLRYATIQKMLENGSEMPRSYLGPQYFSEDYGMLADLFFREDDDIDYPELYARMIADGIETDKQKLARMQTGAIENQETRNVSGSLDDVANWGDGDYWLYFQKLIREGGYIKFDEVPVKETPRKRCRISKGRRASKRKQRRGFKHSYLE